MKRHLPSIPTLITGLSCACALMMSSRLPAQTLYMDVNGDTAGFGNYAASTYQWSTGGGGPAIWTTSAAGTTATSTWSSLGGASHAVFDRAGTTADHTVELQQNLSISKIEVTGGNRMTLSAATAGTVLTLSELDLSAIGGSFYLGTNLSLTGALSITAPSNRNINLNGAYIGSGITLYGGNLFATGTNTAIHFADGGVAQNNSGGLSVGSISGNGKLLTYFSNSPGSASIKVNQSVDGTFSGNISKQESGANPIRFLKEGNATLTLTGTSTYTGTTSVSGGTLRINTNLGNTESVTVETGARLSGTGTTTGVTVKSGGSLGGENFMDALTLDGLTLEAGSLFAVEFNTVDAATVLNDTWSIGGNLSLDGGNTVVLSLSNIGTDVKLNEGLVLTLASFSGSRTGGLFVYDGNILSDGDILAYGGNRFQISYGSSAGSSINLTVTSIPEASTFGLLSLTGALWLAFRARRSRRALLHS